MGPDRRDRARPAAQRADRPHLLRGQCPDPLPSDAHLYASYSRGYKSAGIDLVRQSISINIFVEPEKVDAYEIGLKTQFFDRRVQFNTALFWTTDESYQANLYDVSNRVSYLGNAGKVRSRGVEVDVRATVAKGLSPSASGTFTDASYVRYTNAICLFLQSYKTSCDISGQRLPGTSKWVGAVQARYEAPLGNRLIGYAASDASYRSKFFSSVNDDPFAEIKGDAPFVFSLQSNAGVKAIAAFRVKGDAVTVMVPGRSTIRSFADLFGRKVATPRGSIGHYLLLAGLKRLGKPFDAIDIRFLNPSDGRAALSSGSVDAWAIWDPYAAIGELSDGMRILPIERSWTPGLGFVFASDRALRDKRTELQDFTRRFAAARRWGEAHREDYAQMLTRQTGVPIAATRRYLSRSVYVPVPIDAALIAEEQQIADLFHEAGLLARPVRVAPQLQPL